MPAVAPNNQVSEKPFAKTSHPAPSLNVLFALARAGGLSSGQRAICLRLGTMDATQTYRF